ncbi:MAG: hypothetical protein QME25_03205 [Bacteroidota bacterium]|nr:hypothetical protein [Bacteroidota bacterium]
MARRIHYFVRDNGVNIISDEEWEKIQKLQRWYNSEFIWSAGRLALKMYSIFPNWENKNVDKKLFWEIISKRRNELSKLELSENRIIEQLQEEGLIIAKRGGYRDNCIASGFTKVAGNEFNAYLVCEFLLKVSTIAQKCCIEVHDEGKFIKCQTVSFKNGDVTSDQRKIFSTVNPEKYNNFPRYHTYVLNYAGLDIDDKNKILHDWKWLGFDDNYDFNGDDSSGYDLNKKIRGFS